MTSSSPRPRRPREPIERLVNLGPVSSQWMRDAGIDTGQKLRKLGAIEAFRRVARHRGGDVPVHLLYALEGAIRGVRWDQLPAEERQALRRAAEGERGGSSPRETAAPRRSGPRVRGVTVDDVRTIAFALPEVAESAHMGHPDLRVRNKIFCGIAPDGQSVSLKTTSVNLDALVREAPDTFSNAWGGRWVRVDLGRVSRARLRDLLVDAWRLTAPRALHKQVGTD